MYNSLPRPPLFRDWLATQPDPPWNLDAATVAELERRFARRRIFTRSSARMADAFWGDIAEFGPKYKAMLRMEAMDDDIDPMVSRYLEAEYTSDKEGKQHNAVEGSGKSSGQTITTQERNLTGTSNSGGGSTTTETPGVKTTTDESHSGGYTDTFDADEVVNKGNVHGGESESYDGYSETTSFEDRKSTKERTGTRKLDRSGGETSKDNPESYEETTHLIDTSTSTTRSGKHITEDDRRTASRSVTAAKATPQSAVGLGRDSVSGDGAFNAVKNGSLSNLDFSYASQYGEADGQEGVTGKITEYYDGDSTVIQTDGRKTDNIDRTTYSRNQTKTSNGTEKETFENYKDTDTQSGTEKRGKEGKITRTKNSETEDTLGVRHETTEREDTTRIITSQRQEGENKTTVDNNAHTTTTEGGTISGTDSSETSRSDTRTTDGRTEQHDITHNRYTGREGLTPQDALRKALEYLQTTPPAIAWLIAKLERDFLPFFDLDELYEEEYYA